MATDTKTTLSIIERFIYLIGAVFVSTGVIDGAFLAIDYIPQIFIVILSLLLMLFLVFTHIDGMILSQPRMVLFTQLIIMIAIHTTSSGSIYSGFPRSPLIVFYFAPVLIFAATGNASQWIVAYSIFVLSEYFQFIPLSIEKFNSMDVEILVNQLILQLPFTGYVFVTGFITWFIASKNNRTVSDKSKEAVAHLSAGAQINTPDTHTTLNLREATSTRIYTIDDLSLDDKKNDANLDSELSDTVFFMSRNFTTYSSLGFIFDAKQQVFILDSVKSKSMKIIPKVKIPVGQGIIGNLAVTKIMFSCGNLTNYEYSLDYYRGDEMIYSVIAAPILDTSGELLGALVIDSRDKLAFRNHHKDILSRFSCLSAGSLSKARLLRQKKRYADQLTIVNEASNQFLTTQKPDDVIDVLFNVIDNITETSRIIMVDVIDKSSSMKIRTIKGNSSDVEVGLNFPINDGLYATVVRSHKCIVIGDYSPYNNKYYRFMQNEPKTPSIESIMIIPMILNLSCFGVISIEGTQMNQFTLELKKVITTVIYNASIAYQNAMFVENLNLLATTDGLTKIFNHRKFQELLHEEILRVHRYKRPVALLLMDIDHFKNFNDTYGHSVGDIVLKEIAFCLKETIREQDVAARYGGEEFCIIMPETDIDGAMVIAERIRKAIEALLIDSNDKKLSVTVSIGCAGIPNNATKQQELINMADAAMYHSKNTGRNRVTLFSRSLKKSTT